MTPRAIQTPEHIPELDGLRAIAIVMVMAIHLTNTISPVPEAAGSLPPAVSFVISHGWVGVDLFFVLSGFLITRILISERESTQGFGRYLTRFYTKRAFRILPLYAVVLAGCAFVVPGAASYWRLSAAFLSNYANSLGIETPHFASVFWSLCIEEHYYLLFPLMVWILPARVLGGLLFAVLAVEPLLRYRAFNVGLSVFDVIYLQTQFRLDGLAVGGIIALASRPEARRAQGLGIAALLVVVGAAIQVLSVPYGSMRSTSESPVACAVRFSSIALVFGAVVLACILTTGSPWTSFLRSGFLRWIAKLSYCLYLVHVAVFQLADTALSPIRDSLVSALGGPGFVLARALLLSMAAAGVAQCSWMFLERPMLKIKDRFLK